MPNPLTQSILFRSSSAEACGDSILENCLKRPSARLVRYIGLGLLQFVSCASRMQVRRLPKLLS